MPSFFAICCHLPTFGSHKLTIHLCPPNPELPQHKGKKRKNPKPKKERTNKKKKRERERKMQPRETSRLKVAYRKMWQANKLMVMLVG